MGTIRLGKRTEGQSPVSVTRPARRLDPSCSAAGTSSNNCYGPQTAGVLQGTILDQIKGELAAVEADAGGVRSRYVKRQMSQ
jgi:hypothetical protein